MVKRNGSIFVVLLLVCFQMLNAQKVIRKSLQDPEAIYLEINTENCFKVELTTSKSKEILIEARIDGEYKNDLLVRVGHKGPVVGISAGFQPNFIIPDDKLSAHKVISISLQIQIPENMKVHILGTSTQVIAEGNYSEFKAILDDGSCKLNRIHGSALVTTRSGDINVYSTQGTFSINNSFGSVFRDNIPTGKDYFDLTTTTGEIRLTKIE